MLEVNVVRVVAVFHVHRRVEGVHLKNLKIYEMESPATTSKQALYHKMFDDITREASRHCKTKYDDFISSRVLQSTI